MRLPDVNFGDVFLISLTEGHGLIQCVRAASKTECEIIRALPGIYREPELSNIELIVGKKSCFSSCCR